MSLRNQYYFKNLKKSELLLRQCFFINEMVSCSKNVCLHVEIYIKKRLVLQKIKNEIH